MPYLRHSAPNPPTIVNKIITHDFSHQPSTIVNIFIIILPPAKSVSPRFRAKCARPLSFVKEWSGRLATKMKNMDTAHLNYSSFVDTLLSSYGKEGKGLTMPDSINSSSVRCRLWLALWKMKELEPFIYIEERASNAP